MAIETILVPVDFEPNSLFAVDYAFALAEKLGAKVHLLHAYPPVVVPDGYGKGAIPYEALHQRARERLRDVMRQYADSPAVGKCIADLGDPLSVILDMATALSVDLVVLGTHARTGLQRVMLGSVAEAVMREVAVPVIVAKRCAGDAPLRAADESEAKVPRSHSVAVVPDASQPS